jgi:hypothetical protein
MRGAPPENLLMKWRSTLAAHSPVNRVLPLTLTIQQVSFRAVKSPRTTALSNRGRLESLRSIVVRDESRYRCSGPSCASAGVGRRRSAGQACLVNAVPHEVNDCNVVPQLASGAESVAEHETERAFQHRFIYRLAGVPRPRSRASRVVALSTARCSAVLPASFFRRLRSSTDRTVSGAVLPNRLK